MSALRVAISGCCGRMGSRLVALAAADPGFRVAAAFEHRGHRCVGQDVGACLQMRPLDVEVSEPTVQRLHAAQALIEFTTPAATAANAALAAQARVAMVIGTTGLSPAQQRAVAQAARRVPVLQSPNMSLGVNVLFALCADAARALGPDYDAEIIEMHHAGKQDAPSGTARRAAQLIAGARSRELSRVARYGRHGVSPRRSHDEIGMHALRGGDVVGDHTVVFATVGERLELTHRAQSRDTFARGALRAAQWIVRQRPGLYAMRDLLRLD